jgi:hypothetical protein
MGYYTNYILTVRSRNDQDITENFLTIMNSMYSGWEDDSSADHVFYLNESKWYDHEKDMKKISRMYPDFLFELTGDGEDRLDFWKLHAKNGNIIKVQGTITYPPVPMEFLV